MKKIGLLLSCFLLLIASTQAQTAGFTYNQPSICAPSTVAFTNTSTGNPLSYLWDFGDGFTSINKDPNHPFVNAGTYTVTLTVQYAGGISDSIKQNISVSLPPVFSFTKLNDSICPDGTVSFSSSVTSSIPIQSYSWDFGDGGFGATANPTYQYRNLSNQQINYTVSLTITDIYGCYHKETKNNYVYVKPKPIPDFTIDQQYFCFSTANPAVATFTDSTTVTTNNTYHWMFSDGSTSQQTNPSHTFLNPGNYSVSLTATSSEGCSNTITKQNCVEVIDFKVRHVVSDTIVCSVPKGVTFQGINPSYTEYSWDFGDGTTDNSIFHSITHNYTASGTYIAKVTGIYRSGLCNNTDSTVIHVYDSITADKIIYDSVMYMCEPFLPVLFKDMTPYASSDDFGFGSIVWDFGDSTTASGDSVSHIYPDFGFYQMTLSVTTPYGCKLRDITNSIEIRPYVVDISAFKASSCVPYEVKTTAMDFHSSTYTNITIDWGDGSTSKSDSVISQDKYDTVKRFFDGTHIYNDTLPYYITITAVNEQGCIIHDTIGIVQGGMPPKSRAEYTFVEDCYSVFKSNSPLLIKAFDSLDIYANPIAGVYANSWEWVVKENYMRLEISYEDTVRLGVDRLGYFSVRMIPAHNECCGDTITLDSIAFVCPPIAGFTASSPTPAIFCDFPANVEFESLALNATSCQWFFGDADLLQNQSTDTGKNTSFTYEASNPFVFANSVIPGLHPMLVAYNTDSIDIYSPTYNRCKFCTDTATISVQVSTAVLDFQIPNICESDTIVFSDASTTLATMIGWCFELYPHDSSNHEYEGRFPTIEDFLHRDSLYIDQGATVPFVFHNKDQYTGIFSNLDALGCYRSDTIDFFIYPKSIPDFISGRDTTNLTKGKDTLCSNNPDWLYIRDQSYTLPPFDTADIVAWEWQFFTHHSLLHNPAFLDTLSGMFNIEMLITNEYGCISHALFKEHILINEVTALMTPSREYNCNHTEIEFHNLSYVSPYINNRNTTLISVWDFGDGTPPYTHIGTAPSVSHTYHLSKLPDTIFVTLTVTADGFDCSDTYTNHVIITGPIANFTDDGHQFPCPELGRQIKFTSTSTGNPTKYYWDFGDSISGNANESRLKDPIHDYLHAGSYDINLIVEDSVGCTDTLILPSHVFIDGPVGNFTYGELEGCVGHTVIFTPSTNNADTVIVNPDRASPISNGGIQVHNPISFTYATPGAYLPYFYLIKWTDNNGNPEQCVVEWEGKDTIYIIDITPDFKTDTTYCSSAPITFNNNSFVIPSSVPIDSIIWDFGNGDTLHDVTDGQVLYDKDGIYTVTLDVYAKSCHQRISKDIEILYFPDISLLLDSTTACDTLEVNFQAEVSSGNHGRLYFMWTFQDGEKLYSNPAKKKFDSSGCYYFTLEVSLDSNKCSQIFEDSVYIDIYASPAANFEALPQTANYGEEFQFMDKSISADGSIVKWHWDFGDNATDDQQNTSHIYETSGPMTVWLHIEDEYGCTDKTSLEIMILEGLEFPNVLSPVGNDGKKYVFRPMEKAGYYKDFKIDIYNRWGNHIWGNECKEPNCPDYSDAFWWDGLNKHGKPVEDGVYYWVVTAYPLSETKSFIKNGSVTVFNKR